MRWGAVIAAGGSAGPSLTRETGTSIKALTRFAGRTSLARTLEAIGPVVPEVVTVGAPELAAHVDQGRWVREVGSSVDNVLAGLGELSPQVDAVMLLPADSPLLTAAAISRFQDQVESHFGVQERWFASTSAFLHDFRMAFPEAPVRAVRFAEGRLVASGLYAASPVALRSAVDALRPLVHSRKSQARFLAKLGLYNLFRFAIGRFSVSDVPSLGRRVLGSEAALFTGADPATCLDFDCVEDYRAIQAIIERTEPQTLRVER